MIWRPGPEAPLLLRFAADAALVLHVGGGLVAILSGFVVLAAPKGRRAHRLAGTVFFAAMLAMAGVAALVAPLIADPLSDRITNTNAAVFALYLTLTGWATMKRPAGATGRPERLLVLVPAALVLEAVGLAVIATRTGLRGLETVYVFCALAALAAACDLRVLAAGGVRGPSRTARHLWRMNAALFIATGSLFLGRQRNFPEALQGTVWLLIPPFAVLGGLVFWMIKVLWPARRRKLALAG
jgi:hypothetical protein